ncbi:MAG: hypothetical protein R3246_08760 [Acidimicrobiia bacterium]|nr:hypothetical protein [Acidimicrobiia bacterium]
MSATGRVRAYPVTGQSGPVFPDSSANPNLYAQWGYCGFTLANTSIAQSYRITITDESGSTLDVFDLDPGETRAEWYGPQGITFDQRMSVNFSPDTATGVVVGSVRVG